MNTCERGTLKVWGLLALIALSIVSTSCKWSAEKGLLLEPNQKADPAGWLAWDLGVPRARVVALANLLGVDPQKISRKFPTDYYEDLFLSPPLGKRPSRAEVMAAMKGYAAMCQVHADNPERLAYFFFAADDTKPMEEAPKVTILSFSDDDRVRSVFSLRLDDYDETYKEFEGCIEQRGKLGVMPE